MWCGGRLSWLREPETCPLVVERKRSGLLLTKLCKNLAPGKKKPCFHYLLLENSGKFSKQLVKFHNAGSRSGVRFLVWGLLSDVRFVELKGDVTHSEGLGFPRKGFGHCS